MVALRTTLEEFESFINLPQNLDKRFEWIGGEIFEVPSHPYSSQIAALIIAALLWYLKQHDLGHVTGCSFYFQNKAAASGARRLQSRSTGFSG